MHTRTNLVNQAVIWLVNWNYKAFLQSVNEPHPDDYLSSVQLDAYYYGLAYYHNMHGCALPYLVRSKVNAHDALENIISKWQHGRYGGSPEVKRMVDYYCNLSEMGFNRLSNEVTRNAERRLEIKTNAYWARNMLEKRAVG